MKKIKNLVIVVILFTTSVISSQIVGTISNVSMNGIAVGAGQPINLGANNQVTVKYFVSFTKPVNYTIGAMKLNLDTYKNGAFQINNTYVNNNWADASIETSGWFEHVIYASDIDFGINNYLQVQLQKTLNPTGAWYSNKIKIIKIPTYTNVVQNPAAIVCGSNSNVQFTLNNNDSSNASTFNWTYGSSWQYLGQSGNYITLRPISYPLSDVTVVPSIHGAARGVYGKTPILAPFDTSPIIANTIIQGQSNLCIGDSTTYSLPNSTAFSNVTWGLTNGTTAAVITSFNSSSVTINAINNGLFFVYAVVSNSCGQQTRIQKQVGIGKPYVLNPTIYGINSVLTFGVNQYSVALVPGSSSYNWEVITLSSTCASGTGVPTVITSNGNIATYNWTNCPGIYKIVCTAINNCGGPDEKIGDLIVNVVQRPPSVGGGGGGCSPPTLGLSPNPVAKGGSMSINLLPPPNPCETLLVRSTGFVDNTVKIYDMQGNLRYSNTFKGVDFQISNLNLNKGNYVVNVFTGVGDVIRKVIIIK